MAAIDPERIRTGRQLAEQLALLFDRDPRGVQRLAAKADLSAATVQALITGGTALPRAETVERFVRACGREPGPWLAARARLATAARTARAAQKDHESAPASPAEPLGRMIGELGEHDALALEVHQAFTAPQTTANPVPVLPPYLPRNGFDDRLRAAVAAAEDGSRLVMVVGGSSTGKTRACWEAIRAVLPGWRVWHPLTPERPPAVVEALRGDRLAARSVIWLNEAQFYLQAPQAGESVATALQALLADASRGPVLVLGSMWPDYWSRLTQAPDDPAGRDPHPAVRALLGGAEEITSPLRFTDRQLADLAETIAADPRLRAAARRAPGGQVTQELAGARELLRRYRHAGAAEQALLWAAMDARRLGHGRYLTESFLQHAAPGYLDEHTWDQIGGHEDWFTAAVDRLTAKHRRLPGPLIEHQPRPGEPPFAQPLYRLADYLEQHGRSSRRFESPPEAFWTAATRHITAAEDLEALSAAARDRLRYRHAAELARRAAAAGHFDQLYRLADEFEEHGNTSRAERLYRAGAEAGDIACTFQLMMIRERYADHAEAERLAFSIAEKGNGHPLERLVEHRWENGRRDRAEQLAIRAFRAGHQEGLWYVARDLWRTDGHAGAARMYRVAADAGEVQALVPLAETTDDPDEADRLYRAAAERGIREAMWEMARRAEEAGDYEECERYVRLALTAKQSMFSFRETLWHLVRRCEERGNHQGAERLNAIAEANGVSFLSRIARLRMDADDDAAAVSMAPDLAAAGETRTLGVLARRREAAGDSQGAEHLARLAFEAGDPEPLRDLARLRELSGAAKDAERLYVLARDHAALRAKARRLEQAGDLGEAVRFYRIGADLGDALALHALARVRESEGDLDQAERLATEAACAGDTRALRTLAWMRECRGDRPTAERLAVKTADYGSTGALRALAVARERAGDRDGAESLARRAAGYGDTRTLAVLAHLRMRGGAGDQAERLYESAAQAGDPLAVRTLATLCERAGDAARAEELARRAAVEGDRGALWDLARLREQAGKHSDAAWLYRAAASGAVDVLADMADRRARAGDLDGAERLALIAAELGDGKTLLSLLRLRVMAGDRSGAKRLVALLEDVREVRLWFLLMFHQVDRHDIAEDIALQIAGRGSPEPLDEVAASVSRIDPVRAERLWRLAAEAGSVNALLRLAESREQAGDHAEAEQWVRRLCEAGSDEYSITRMAKSRRERGDHRGAERLYRILVEFGKITPLFALSRLRREFGDEPEAERLARQAADAGYSTPLVSLARELARHDVWQRLLRYGLEADGRVADPW
ncbi:hypothetical protein [Streptosporangium pseudovulgare]|uniref:HTH cro/C1-type domain-containing protein n=1 Tax=Streptosporangium pseudovulgare TaxID=35765 RepID=A0ABQ2RBB6_9ACTN|nr:hypothetical protein [Streptosporangium pseudovulgare]GGQ18027.1 hypothetical protein GCM10010140_55520 [Streptosporangium pseudovulgare]